MTSVETEFFEERAFRLPAHERAKLADRLIASLDHLSETEHEQMWVEEAAARYEAYKQGKVASYPVEEVLREVRAALK